MASGTRRGSTRRRRVATAGAFAALVAAGLSASLAAGTRTGDRTGATVLAAPAAPLAPNGTYTTPSGATATIASLRGTPTMVWFVAGGCASCAASIPAVATHLAALRRDGLRVLTLGLAGAFAPGRTGATELLRFAQAAASTRVRRPGWSWGMASRSLSLAYDPDRVPDVYVLIDRNGRLRYRGSVPVSTMPELLAAAARLGGDARTGDPGATTP